MNLQAYIYLRADQVNKNGTQTLCMRVIQNRKKKVFSLPIKILPTDWNDKNKEVKNSDCNFKSKNKIIKTFDKRANDIIADFYIKDKFLSIEEFEKQLFSNLRDNNSFYKFVENELKIIENEKSIEYSTLKTYKSSLEKMKQYKKELTFNELDTTFLTKYKSFVLSANNENSTKRNLRFIRSFINRAIAKGVFNEKNPFENFTIGKETSRLTHLERYEFKKLKLIYDNKELPKNLHETLKIFLFSCHTSIRISDLLSLKFEHIQPFYTEIETNIKFKIYKKPIKTGNKTSVMIDMPLVKYAENLIEFIPNRLPQTKIFNTFSEKTLNEHLKKIAAFAEIDKNLTMHVARHTFGTLSNELGGNIETTKVLMAHANINSTLGYVKITDNAKLNQMEKWNS